MAKNGREAIVISRPYISKVLSTSESRALFMIMIYLNQTAFVEDRFIRETVRSVFEIIHFIKKEIITGLVIFLDFPQSF